MTRFIPSIYLILVTVSLSAQDLKFIHGKPSQKKLNHYDKKYGREEFKRTFFDTLSRTSYHQTWGSDNKINIEILTEYVNESSTAKNFDISQEPGYFFQRLENINGKFYTFYSIHKGKESQAWVQEMKADLTPRDKPQQLATFQVPNDTESFWVYLTKGGDQILFITDFENKIQVKSFSSSFKPLWSKSFDIKTDGIILETLGSTPDGHLYVGGYYSKKGERTDPFVIAYSTKTQQHQVNYFTKEEGINLFNFNMSALKDNVPIVGCIYTKKKEMGYRFYKVNPATLRLDQFATQPISDEFKKATVLGYKDNNFGIVGIEKLKNGNIAFSIEGQVVQNPMKFGDPARSSEIFYSSPTNVICINDSGNELWDKLVKKFQRQGTASHLIGHYFFQNNNKVYIVYNDVNENFNLNPLADQKAWMLKEKNMYVAIAEIDETGAARKLNLVTKTPNEVSYFVVDQTEQITDNLFRFKVTTPRGIHYSLLEVN